MDTPDLLDPWEGLALLGMLEQQDSKEEKVWLVSLVQYKLVQGVRWAFLVFKD